ncbi:hypothetical protein B0E46_08560 [Rhodanobacter sp. B04]|nr:hypothetical protein B0E46_08560 [Rhodanobacter sp. B04]
MQIHLWILTGVLGIVLLGNIACNYRNSRHNGDYQKMKSLWETRKHLELLAFTSARLQRFPASSMHLMYKTMSLLALGRLDEAEAAAETFKDAAPNMRHEALGLLGSIAEKRAGPG